jgi:hypothetical protein
LKLGKLINAIITECVKQKGVLVMEKEIKACGQTKPKNQTREPCIWGY